MLLWLAEFLPHDGVLTLVSGQLSPAEDSIRRFVAYSLRGQPAPSCQNPATSAQHFNNEVLHFFKKRAFEEVRKDLKRKGERRHLKKLEKSRLQERGF